MPKISDLPLNNSPQSGDYIIGDTVPITSSSTYKTTIADLLSSTGSLEPSRTVTKTVAPVGTTADYNTDGVADDVEIQAAIDSLPSTGGSILLRAGTYNFTSQVSRSIQNVKLYGEGFATVLQWQSGTNPSSIGVIRTYNFWTISNLQINGNKANNTGGFGIYIYQSTRVIIEDMYIANCADDSIRLDGGAGVLMSHANKFSNLYILNGAAYGINAINSTPDNQFVNIWVGQCLGGMHIGAAACFLTNVHLWGNTNNGLEIAASDTRVTNGYYETNGLAGISIVGTSPKPVHDIKIVGANLLLNMGGGITTSFVNKSVISASSFKDNTGPGINFADSADCIVVGSVFGNDNSPQLQTYGVTSTGASDRITLNGNNILATNESTGNYLLVGSNNEIYGTFLKDTNNTLAMTVTPTASAINYLDLANAATGGYPQLTAKGGDTNVGINYRSKGSGSHVFLPGVNTAGAWAVKNALNTVTTIVADTANTRVGVGMASPTTTLDVAGVINVNSNKITSLANGTTSTDAAAFGQIPTSASTIGGLLAANNLSDVNSATTSATNLGLGTGNTPTHAGLNLGSGSLNTVGNIEVDGTAARDYTVARSLSGAGQGLTVSAGSGQVTTSNLAGGNITLQGGISTGTGGSRLLVNLAPTGSSSTSDNAVQTSLVLLKTNVTAGQGIQLVLNNTITGAVNGITLNGNIAQTIYPTRHTTANTAGNNLTLQSGSATSAATDKSAGNLILATGLSTGAGTGNIQLQVTGNTAGSTSDNTLSTIATVDLTGLTLGLTRKLAITTGTNASAGTGTLTAGTVTISTTAVTANSLIFLTDTASSITNVGTLTVSSKSAGTSFTVTSTLALDTSTFNWLIVN